VTAGAPACLTVTIVPRVIVFNNPTLPLVARSLLISLRCAAAAPITQHPGAENAMTKRRANTPPGLGRRTTGSGRPPVVITLSLSCGHSDRCWPTRARRFTLQHLRQERDGIAACSTAPLCTATFTVLSLPDLHTRMNSKRTRPSPSVETGTYPRGGSYPQGSQKTRGRPLDHDCRRTPDRHSTHPKPMNLGPLHSGSRTFLRSPNRPRRDPAPTPDRPSRECRTRRKRHLPTHRTALWTRGARAHRFRSSRRIGKEG